MNNIHIFNDKETKGSNKIPYLRTENLKNHAIFRGTYLYSPYMGVPSPQALEQLENVVHLTGFSGNEASRGHQLAFQPKLHHARQSAVEKASKRSLYFDLVQREARCSRMDFETDDC